MYGKPSEHSSRTDRQQATLIQLKNATYITGIGIY